MGWDESLTGRGLPTIGAIFQVVRMEQVDTKVRVVLRSETGDELEYLG